MNSNMVANQAIDRLIMVTNKFSKGAKLKSIPSVKCLSDVQSLDTEVMKLLSETGQSWLSRELNNIYVREEDMSSAELQQHGKNAVAALLKRESLEQRYQLLTPAVKKEASSVKKEEAEDSKGNVAKKSIGKSIVSSQDKMSKMREIIARNARSVEQGEVDFVEGNRKLKGVYFLDVMTRVTREEREYNPHATFERDGYYYEIESDESRQTRLDVWNTIVGLMKSLDSSLWSNVKKGDVYSLRLVMRKCYGRDVERKEIRKCLTKMDNMKKDRYETYESFYSRYTETKDDLERLMKTQIHEQQIELYVNEMIKRSDDETKKMFLELRSSHECVDKQDSELLEMMRERMSIRESVIGLTVKNRKDKDKNDRDSLADEVKTLKIDKDQTKRTEQMKRTVPLVCIHYQSNEGCKFGTDCIYEHKKLNKNELKELKETIAKGREKNEEKRRQYKKTIKCYKCGKKGHFARECVSVGKSPPASKTADSSAGSTVKSDSSGAQTNVVVTMSESEYIAYMNSKKNRN